MTSTKTKKTKLIVREQEFADLIRQRKELANSIADSQNVLKSLDDKIFEAMQKENLTSVEIEGVGLAEIVQSGGNVTWDQEILSKLIRKDAKKKKINEFDLLVKICALKARPSIAESVNLEIDGAKIVGKFTEKLKIQ